MANLSARALRVAMYGFVPLDDPHIIADLQAKIESDAKEIAALRETIREIGDLADKATHGGRTTFLYGATLRDIIFRCATALPPTDEQTAGEKS